MIEWLKNHIEAVICFALFGLLVLTSLYFLGTEQQRLRIEDLEEFVVSEVEEEEIIEERIQDLEARRRRVMTAFAEKPITHYELLFRRNPFVPLEEVDDDDEIEDVDPDLPEPEPEPDFLVRGIIRVGEELVSHVENRATGATYFLREGDEVEGHLVEDISREKVSLRKNDETEELIYRR